MRKREWIITFGATALVITLFSIGSFLVYWGVWGLLYGHTRPGGLDEIFWGSGGFIIFLGIYVASMLVSYLLRKRGAKRPTITPSGDNPENSFKPELTTLEARQRLALNEGQKENKRQKGEETIGKD